MRRRLRPQRLFAIAAAILLIITATFTLRVHRRSSVRSSQLRLALLIPFAAKYNVPYWGIFCRGAVGAAGIADFIILHNGVLEDAVCADNVILINLQSNQNLGKRLLRVLDHKNETVIERSSLEELMTTLLDLRPYALVEFKPALGYIFQDLLEGYSHWGYTDLDIVFGDLSHWITEDELLNYDIVTYSYGDQRRLYLRGQFTFHKNNDKVNNIWRYCRYLRDLDERFDSIVKSKGHFRVESAEGCYSAAVLDRNDVRVKYVPHAWTDTHDEAGGTFRDILSSHGVYLARSKSRQVLYRAKSAGENARLVARLDPSYWDKNGAYTQRDISLGSLEAIDIADAVHNDVKCMYWVPSEYQAKLCLSALIASDETLYWINGSLYKQKVVLHDEGLADTAPFFHFQEWKRHYRYNEVASCHAGTSISTYLFTQFGAIPLPHSKVQRILKGSRDSSVSPLGLAPQKWDSSMEFDRRQLPLSQYCIVGSATKLTKSPCRTFIEWTNKNATTILAPAQGWNFIDVESDVTLILTLQISADQSSDKTALKGCMDPLIDNVDRWFGQPSVTIIFMAGATKDSMRYVHEQLGPESIFTQHHKNAFVAAIFDEEISSSASRKALQNMATDVAPTRWFISGLEVESGLIISNEAAYLAQAAITSRKGQHGNVFYLPQFALSDIDGDASQHMPDTDRLIASRRTNKVHFVHEFNQCERNGAFATERVFNALDQVWWKYTESTTANAEEKDHDININQQEKDAIRVVEISLLTFMVNATQESFNDVFRFQDESFILLKDNLSPKDPNIRTSVIARNVEALEGSSCYNGLHLSQLIGLGYRINVLPGAFAMSTAKSRASVGLGKDHNRCQRCTAGPDDSEDTTVGAMDHFVKREIQRIASSAIVWMEYSETL
ncbi:hypothetical protein FisN_5Lh150 [Fistulifera solaris]|uniref:Uncharacterized protein n=1 Tax=Fistulifera solaris TaxID=1519565 RepID=A0A1Z5JIW8_FISSO|nr:hypothetical protein FisN_5Lh150 [Fistulifera solaris]|eukprot:GAX13943.1 hypothetical protein FisN_5Lh150 [Fistulifera solaris]